MFQFYVLNGFSTDSLRAEELTFEIHSTHATANGESNTKFPKGSGGWGARNLIPRSGTDFSSVT